MSWVPGYLSERCLADAIHTHQLGHAPKGWTSLTDHLRSLGYTDDHIEASGMAARARNGHLIDRFRDRLTIPIRDQHGDIVGFTARQGPHHIQDRDGPRYLNSPATAIFSKRELLYGLGDHLAGLAADDLPVLCEGPLDAIAVDLAAAQTEPSMVGIATCGTALTAPHARQLHQLVGDRPICIAFDADPAGHAAAEAAWLRLTDQDPRDILIADLQGGGDPASRLMDGPQSLAHDIHCSTPAPWVVAENQIRGANLDGNPARELAAFRTLVGYAARMPADQRTGYVLQLAKRLRLDPVEVAADVADHLPGPLLDRVLEHCRQLETPDSIRTDREIPASSTQPTPTTRLTHNA
jgi:DNA primase catalytic core